MSIQPLPQDVVTRIAAGEVIDSLAAVVRELVENSIDAGATRIRISLWPEQWRVQVADNGQGMTPEDLAQAAQPHSTSKLSTHPPTAERPDTEHLPPQASASLGLDNVRSLGFRGEALHSLSQLAQLEICSRTMGQTEGWQARYGAGGSLTSLETVAIAPGTIITVSELFAAWPARRQALPHPAQQLRQIQRLVQLIALAHPGITWNVSQGDRDWFSLWPGSSAQMLLPQMLRGVAEADLRATSLLLSDVEGNPPFEEGGGLRQGEQPDPPRSPLEEGGGWRQDEQRDLPQSPLEEGGGQRQKITATPEPPLLQGGGGSLVSKLHLIIGLPDRCHRRRPDWIKIAVNGRCIRLPELEQTLLGAMRRSLPRDRYPVAFIHIQTDPSQVDWNRHPAKAEIYLRHLPQWQEALKQAVIQALQLAPEAAQITEGARVQDLLKAAEQGAGYSINRHINPNAKSDAQTNAEGIRGQGLKALAQVHNTYIVAEHPGGLWLVEQHIAHERVLYEEICDRWHCIPLEPPIVLDQLKKRQLTQLDRIGIELEPFGEDLWAARSAPALLSEREDCAAALIELSLGGDLQTAQVATACRSAIRNGTALSLSEMQQLLDQWQQTRQPQTCPHGRPIHMVLAETSLARFFRRNWVIGKSHGI